MTQSLEGKERVGGKMLDMISLSRRIN